MIIHLYIYFSELFKHRAEYGSLSLRAKYGSLSLIALFVPLLSLSMALQRGGFVPTPSSPYGEKKPLRVCSSPAKQPLDGLSSRGLFAKPWSPFAFGCCSLEQPATKGKTGLVGVSLGENLLGPRRPAPAYEGLDGVGTKPPLCKAIEGEILSPLLFQRTGSEQRPLFPFCLWLLAVPTNSNQRQRGRESYEGLDGFSLGENLLGLDGVGTKPPAIEGEILSPTFVPTNRERAKLSPSMASLREGSLQSHRAPRRPGPAYEAPCSLFVGTKAREGLSSNGVRAS